MIAAGPEAFRHGSRGVVDEAHICAQPWGFDLTEIPPPVHIWHGDVHRGMSRVAMAHTLAARIPDSHLTLFHEQATVLCQSTGTRSWPPC